MTPPPTEHHGTLRPRFSALDDNRLKVEWVSSSGVAVWTETIKMRDGCAACSQIECTGDFQVQQPVYVDQGSNLRHFVLHAERGQLGSVFPN